MHRAGRREQGGGSTGALEEGAGSTGLRCEPRIERQAPETECVVSCAGRMDQRAPDLWRREHRSSPEKQGAGEEAVSSRGEAGARDREHRRRMKKQGAPEAATHGEKPRERPRAGTGSRCTERTQERESVRVRVTWRRRSGNKYTRARCVLHFLGR